MDKKDEALKLALEFIDANTYGGDDVVQLMTAIREALAEQPAQQQEPYGQVTVVRRPGCVDQHWFYRWPEPPYLDNAAECQTVYTSPPASKPWVGLTDEDIAETCGFGEYATTSTRITLTHLARAIEAKLREKNT